MKHNVFVSALLGSSLILLALSSCASSPKPVAPETTEEPVAQTAPQEQAPEQPAPEVIDPSKIPPDQAAESALAEAKARAEKARKQAFDLEAPSVFADDWAKAEALFLTGRDKAQVKTMLSYQEAAEAYNGAADSYDALALKSLPLYAEARRKEIEKARSEALLAGAANLAPDQLASADLVADTAQSQYDGGDYYAAAASAQEARIRYIAIKTALDAYAIQREIDQRGFAQYDSGNYALALQSLQGAQASYDSGAINAAQNRAEEALLRFRLALNKGKEMNASGRGQAAQAERQAAQDLKAHVAVKSDFEKALAVYNEAERAFKAEQYDQAAELYAQAQEQFAEVKTIAAEKRAKALEAMQAAEQKITATEDAAKKADTVLEGGSR